MKKIKKIVITGGCGFIGSHLSEFYFDKYKNTQIIIYDKMTYAAHKLNIVKILKSKRVFLIKKDICDLRNLIQHTKNNDLLIHAAAESHVDNSFIMPENFVRTNILGTKNVMEAALINKIKNIIHISTDEVYGEILKGKFNEESSLNPSNPYSSSKAAAEMIILGYIKSYRLPVKIIRPNNIYGIRQHPEKLIAGFLWCLVKNKKFTLHGNGYQKRKFLHVKDFCKSVDAIFIRGKNYEFYNVGTNQEFRNIDLIKLMCKIFNKNFEDYVVKIPDRVFNDARYSINYNKVKKLGWRPKLRVKNSLYEIFNWTNNNQDNFSR